MPVRPPRAARIRVDPFTTHRFLRALETSGSVGGGHRLGTALHHRARRRRDDRGRTGLSQEPFARRVCLRLVLGRCLGTRRRAVLPEAADRRALHPGHRAPVSHPARSRGTRPGRHRAGRGAGRGRGRAVVVHVTFCTDAEAAAGKAMGLIDRLGTQYHWDNDGLRKLRRFPRHPRQPQAQGDPARAARRRRISAARSSSSPATRCSPNIGTSSGPSTRTPAAANGARPISPAPSSTSSRRRCATTCCWCSRDARRPARRRRAQFHRP